MSPSLPLLRFDGVADVAADVAVGKPGDLSIHPALSFPFLSCSIPLCSVCSDHSLLRCLLPCEANRLDGSAC